MAQPDAFYRPVPDGALESTSATTSPWTASLQHGEPPSALLGRAIEQHQPRSDMAVGRVSVDFLGGLAQGLMELETETIRPGQRIELVESRLTVAGRVVAVARAWRT